MLNFCWIAGVFCVSRTSLVAQMVKRLPTMQETWVRSLGWEDPLEKEMAIHSSTLAWKIPWMVERGRLQSMESQRVEHDWVALMSMSMSMKIMVTFSHGLSYGSTLTCFSIICVHKFPEGSSSYEYKLECFRMISIVLLWLIFINLNFSINFTNLWVR